MTAFRQAVDEWDAEMLEQTVRLTRTAGCGPPRRTVRPPTTSAPTVRNIPRTRSAASMRLPLPRCGGGFPVARPGVRIPLFDEVLVELPQMRIMVEPKAAEAAGPLVEVIRAREAEHRVLIGAEIERTRDGARGYGGPWGASRSQVMPFWLLHRIPVIGRWYVPAVDAFQVPETSGRYRVVTPAFVRAAHRANIPVHVWTVNDPDDMRRLLEWGVDGIRPTVQHCWPMCWRSGGNARRPRPAQGYRTMSGTGQTPWPPFRDHL